MGNIVLVGCSDWFGFAKEILENAGESTIWYRGSPPEGLSPHDLVILGVGPEDPPSPKIGGLFQRQGPLRILVMDAREDFGRAGDAARAHAVGYEGQRWSKENLLQIVSRYKSTKAPGKGVLARRFGS